jgi:hypothetical protein
MPISPGLTLLFGALGLPPAAPLLLLAFPLGRSHVPNCGDAALHACGDFAVRYASGDSLQYQFVSAFPLIRRQCATAVPLAIAADHPGAIWEVSGLSDGFTAATSMFGLNAIAVVDRELDDLSHGVHLSARLSCLITDWAPLRRLGFQYLRGSLLDQNGRGLFLLFVLVDRCFSKARPAADRRKNRA